jgi:hypothetical protein
MTTTAFDVYVKNKYTHSEPTKTIHRNVSSSYPSPTLYRAACFNSRTQPTTKTFKPYGLFGLLTSAAAIDRRRLTNEMRRHPTSRHRNNAKMMMMAEENAAVND